jgi:hypothetical protein
MGLQGLPFGGRQLALDLRQLPKLDIYGELPHPSGDGDMLCGTAAAQRVKRENKGRDRDFAVLSLEIDRVRCVLVRSFLVRSWCGSSGNQDLNPAGCCDRPHVGFNFRTF